LLAPFAALLAGWTWKTFQDYFQNKKRWMRISVSIAVFIGAFGMLGHMAWLSFQKTPMQICRMVYGSNPFPEYPMIADYVQKRTRPEEKIAILGSEPSLYFLMNRRPATPYLCVYEMVKPHSFARSMQEEAIRCIEKERPPFMILVDLQTSWEIRPESDRMIFQWFEIYTPKHYELDGVIDLVSEANTVARWGSDAQTYRPQSNRTLKIFRRKS
jgi:hypothetical protein